MSSIYAKFIDPSAASPNSTLLAAEAALPEATHCAMRELKSEAETGKECPLARSQVLKLVIKHLAAKISVSFARLSQVLRRAC